MSNQDVVIININDWIEKARADPVAYLERQATEILLAALGTTEPYCEKFFLKGGLMMGIVYDSPRHTVDIDYSTILEPDGKIVDNFKKTMNDALPAVAAKLGYPDIVCQIQTIKLRPREKGFSDCKAPGFKITAGYAKRGSTQEKRVSEGSAANVLHADVSFKEPVGGIQIVKLGVNGPNINAYSLNDMVSEKFRAFLQQEDRNRNRRQDIYDLNLLLGRFSFDEQERQEILDLLLKKCHAREIFPDKGWFEREELIKRARSEWGTMELEIGMVPDFDTCYQIVKEFYDSLPWK